MCKVSLEKRREIFSEENREDMKEKKETCSESDMDYIDKRMSAVEEIMKKQTGAECRKNVWETVNKLKGDYPCCIDYIDNIFNGLVEKYRVDFFEDIRERND